MELTRNVAKPPVARRVLAFFIDSVIAWGAFGLLAWGINTVASYILGALVAAAYYGLRDGLTLRFMAYRSLGKRLVGLRPARLDTRPMTLKASVRRNWMFSALFVGFLPFFSPIGLLLALGVLVIVIYEGYLTLCHPEGRRWGDELAGTTVIVSGSAS